MDSFFTLASIFSNTEGVGTQPPADQESGGGSGNSYCVVSRTDITETPVNEESGGGSGNSYCAIVWYPFNQITRFTSHMDRGEDLM